MYLAETENFYKEYLSITNDPTLKESLFTYNNVKTAESGKPSPSSIMKTKRRKNVFGKSKRQICLYRCLGDLVWPLSSRNHSCKKLEEYQGKILNLSAFQLTT
jgi:hypothetical protein